MNLPTRQQRRILWIIGTMCWICVVVILLCAWLTPPALPSAPTLDPFKVVNPIKPAEPRWSLTSLQQLSAIPLRRELYDKPVAIADAKIPPLPIKLTGTMIDPGNNLAIFATKDGGTEMKSVGQTLGDVKVMEITPNRVVILYFNKEIPLVLEEDRP